MLMGLILCFSADYDNFNKVYTAFHDWFYYVLLFNILKFMYLRLFKDI